MIRLRLVEQTKMRALFITTVGTAYFISKCSKHELCAVSLDKELDSMTNFRAYYLLNENITKGLNIVVLILDKRYFKYGIDE